MAKLKKNKKLNTDLDETTVSIDASVLEPLKDIVITEESDVDHDDQSYTMGVIKAEDVEDDDDEEFKKAAKNINTNNESEDEEAAWVEEEEYNQNDSDSFLDEENYDLDNPEYDDSY